MPERAEAEGGALMPSGQFYLGKSGKRHGLALPADAVTRTFGIFGVKASGKTTTARTLAEGIVKTGGNVVVLDPVGVWWGITRQGEGPGIPGIVIGGEHGDVPLEETGGELVAELAVGRQWPAVVVDLKLLRKGAAQRFMADFLEVVYFRNRRPLHLLFEEADRALPQSARAMDPTLGRVIGAAEDIVKLGRSRGLGSTFISQRFATVTKNVTEQVEALVLHAQPGPNDRKAVKAWVEANGDPAATAKVMDSMASLSQGTAWFYSPAWLHVLEEVHVRMPKTLDSSSTPTNEQAELEGQAKRAPVDLEELRRLMSETVERAEANDPKALQARVEELEREVERARAEAPAPEVERVLVPDREAMEALSTLLAGVTSEVEQIEMQATQLRDASESLGELAGKLSTAAEGLSGALDQAAALPPEGRRDSVVNHAPPSNGATARPEPTPAIRDGMNPSTRQLVEDLRRFAPLHLDRGQLALLLGRGKRSSTLTQQLAEAVDAGALERDLNGRYRVRDDSGRRWTKAELREAYSAALPDGPRALFDVLVRADGSVSRGWLFSEAGFSQTSSTPVTHLKLLTDNGLAEKLAGGGVQLGPAVR